MERLPCRYPIFSTLTPGRAEGLCAERHRTVNTLRVLRLSGSLYSLINLRVEPRASSSCTVHSGDSVPREYTADGSVQGIPRDVQ